jgi:hypothetical protein
VHLAGGKLAGRGAPAFLRPGNSIGIIASAAADAGSSGAPASVAGGGGSSIKPGRLFFLKDAVSQMQFLIDTGSSYSILPHKSKARPFGPTLRAAASGVGVIRRRRSSLAVNCTSGSFCWLI